MPLPEKLDQDTGGILITICNHSFHCSCISRWTDSSCPVSTISSPLELLSFRISCLRFCRDREIFRFSLFEDLVNCFMWRLSVYDMIFVFCLPTNLNKVIFIIKWAQVAQYDVFIFDVLIFFISRGMYQIPRLKGLAWVVLGWEMVGCVWLQANFIFIFILYFLPWNDQR